MEHCIVSHLYYHPILQMEKLRLREAKELVQGLIELKQSAVRADSHELSEILLVLSL